MSSVTAVSMQQALERVHGMIPQTEQAIARPTVRTLTKTRSMTHPGRWQSISPSWLLFRA